MTRAGPVNAIANQLTRRLSLEHGFRFKPLGSVNQVTVGLVRYARRVLDIWPLPSSGVQLDLCLSMFGSIAIMLPVRRVGPAGARAQQIPGAQVPRRCLLGRSHPLPPRDRKRNADPSHEASRPPRVSCDPFARCRPLEALGLAKFGVPDRGRCAARLLGSTLCEHARASDLRNLREQAILGSAAAPELHRVIRRDRAPGQTERLVPDARGGLEVPT